MPGWIETAIGFIDPSWIFRQFSDGDAVPFLIWSALMAAAGFFLSSLSNRKALRKKVNEMDFGMKCSLAALKIRDIELTYLDSREAEESGDEYEDMYDDPSDARFVLMMCEKLDALHGMGLADYRTVSGWERLWSLSGRARRLIMFDKGMLDGTEKESMSMLARIDYIMSLD